MSKTKIGVFSALLFGVMMLLIPATSIANAAEYDRYGKINNDVYYEDDRYYEEIQYNDRDGYYDDNGEYVYEEYYYPPSHKDKKKEPPMLLVKKDVLYCDVIANGTGSTCGFPIPGPDSDRYVQECTTDLPCDNLNEATFKMIVTDNVEFPGSEEGKKLNFNGERYTVTEKLMLENPEANLACQEAGFDFGIISFNEDLFCTVFEGDCSGIIQDGELKECTVKNYMVAAD